MDALRIFTFLITIYLKLSFMYLFSISLRKVQINSFGNGVHAKLIEEVKTML